MTYSEFVQNHKNAVREYIADNNREMLMTASRYYYWILAIEYPDKGITTRFLTRFDRYCRLIKSKA